MRIKRYRMFWKSHFPEDFPILRKLDLNQPKGRTGKAFGVRIFGKLREPNAASRDAGFSMVSYCTLSLALPHHSSFITHHSFLVTPLLGWKWGLAGNRVWKRASQQAQFGLLSESKPAERDKK